MRWLRINPILNWFSVGIGWPIKLDLALLATEAFDRDSHPHQPSINASKIGISDLF